MRCSTCQFRKAVGYYRKSPVCSPCGIKLRLTYMCGYKDGKAGRKIAS